MELSYKLQILVRIPYGVASGGNSVHLLEQAKTKEEVGGFIFRRNVVKELKILEDKDHPPQSQKRLKFD